jgi:hypothetical protein
MDASLYGLTVSTNAGSTRATAGPISDPHSALIATISELQALRQSTSAEAPMEAAQALTPAPETVTVTARPARPKAILPDPPKFDGTRSERRIESLIKDKVDIDGEVIGSVRNQFIYVTPRLKGKDL